jgi:hypothetical protein
VRGEEIGVGTGGSKQAAREEAARKALLSMGWQVPYAIEFSYSGKVIYIASLPGSDED